MNIYIYQYRQAQGPTRVMYTDSNYMYIIDWITYSNLFGVVHKQVSEHRSMTIVPEDLNCFIFRLYVDNK